MQSIEEKKPFDVIIEINKFLGFELQTTERYKANQKQRNGLIAQSKHKKIVRKEFVFCLFGFSVQWVTHFSFSACNFITLWYSSILFWLQHVIQIHVCPINHRIHFSLQRNSQSLVYGNKLAKSAPLLQSNSTEFHYEQYFVPTKGHGWLTFKNHTKIFPTSVSNCRGSYVCSSVFFSFRF